MRYLTDEPVEACPPSAWYRFGKFARRNRGALATAALVATALVLGTAVSTWQAVRATRAEQAARQQRDAATAARDAEGRARKRAEEAEKTARAEADKATAINEFLVNDLLKQAQPDDTRVALSDRLTLQQVLDQAAEKVGVRFREKPLLEAALRTTIGETYKALGIFDKSRSQYAAALEIYRREKGPRAVETARCMEALGCIFIYENNLEQAELLSRQALAVLRSALGEGHTDTLAAMGTLAWACRRQGKLAEAETLYARALEAGRTPLAKITRRRFG